MKRSTTVTKYAPYKKRRYTRRTPVPRPIRYNPAYDTHKFKLRIAFNVSSDASGQIFTYFSTSDPTIAHGGTGTYTDWTSLSAVYDSYKVTGLGVEFVPRIPWNTTNNMTTFCLAHDVDSSQAPASRDEVLQYTKMKTMNTWTNQKVYFPVPELSSDGNPVGWLDAGAAGTSANQISCVKVAAVNLSNSLDYGLFILTMYVTMCHRR